MFVRLSLATGLAVFSAANAAPLGYPFISNKELHALAETSPVKDLAINCTAGGTPCAAAYSAIGAGCCPYEGAVCCSNQQTCCPAGNTCVEAGPYGTTCVPTNGGVNTTGLSVCKSGPNVPLSTTQPNILIIGDSVSIGYTPHVAERMKDKALVLHSPLDVRDGGAEETAYGMQCLEYFLHAPAGNMLQPDVIMCVGFAESVPDVLAILCPIYRYAQNHLSN